MGRRLLLRAGRDQLVPCLTLLSHYTLYKRTSMPVSFDEIFFPAKLLRRHCAAAATADDVTALLVIFMKIVSLYCETLTGFTRWILYWLVRFDEIFLNWLWLPTYNNIRFRFSRMLMKCTIRRFHEFLHKIL